jgi:hypothetical protein
MWRHVALLRVDVSEKRIAFIIREETIGRLGTTYAVSRSFYLILNVIIEAIYSSETSGLRRATRRHIQVDGIFHSHRHENLKTRKIIILLNILQYGKFI